MSSEECLRVSLLVSVLGKLAMLRLPYHAAFRRVLVPFNLTNAVRAACSLGRCLQVVDVNLHEHGPV